MDIEKLRYVLQQRELPKAPSVGVFHPACVLMPIFERNSEAYILAVLKADTEGYPWRNQVALPGGHVDSSDDSTLSATYRELREELNIDAERIEMIGSMGYFQTIRQTEIEAFVGILNGTLTGLRYDPQEISEVIEIRLVDLVKTHHRNQYQGYRPDIASLLYPTGAIGNNGDIVIWGVTAMIIHFFLEHLRALSPEMFGSS